MPSSEEVKAAENIGASLVDTLNEHARPYDNSKAEIVDFFLTAFCGDSARNKSPKLLNCPYKIHDRIEYLSFFKKKWLPGIVIKLIAKDDKLVQNDTIQVLLDSGNDRYRLVEKPAWEYKLRRMKERK